MRQTASEIQRRALLNLQTEANNNNPSMEIVVTRPRTPIFAKQFWQESIVAAGSTSTRTSVAVRRMGVLPDKVYVAFIAGGVLTVKSSTVIYPIENMGWSIETTIAGCIACALEFDGSFSKIKRNVEYRTDALPWLFYVTSSGQLMAGILGGSFESLVGSGVSAIDAVRGVASVYKDVDQGLMVFYVLLNHVYYKQFINGAWSGQQEVVVAGDTAVQIKAERLFDYRIVLQITNTSGELWEIFSKMEGSGWIENEYISASLSCVSALVDIVYLGSLTAENITASLSAISATLYAFSPVMVSAENIDDGEGNYGLKINLTWDERIFGESGQEAAFSLSDGYGGAWAGTGLTKTGKVLTITFIDFNNATNPVTLTYTPGAMMGDVVAVAADSITFDASDLIPSELPIPRALTGENLDAKQIIVSFNMIVESVNWVNAKAGFTVSAQEYDMIPDGTTSLKTYVIDSVGNLIEVTDETLATSEASLTDTVLTSGAIELALNV